MVDAAIGGKNGVNADGVKNFFGSVYHPKQVFINVDFLDTLSDIVFQQGLSEMAKHALLDTKQTAKLFLEKAEKLYSRNKAVLIAMIQDNVSFKKRIVARSAIEPAVRDILNFGHTIGHALEALSDYRFLHGQAVCLGMLVEGYIAYQLGYLSKEDLAFLQDVVQATNNVPLLRKSYSKKAWKRALMLDKKSKNSTPQFVLLEAVGRVHREGTSFSHPVPSGKLDQAINWLENAFLDEHFFTVLQERST